MRLIDGDALKREFNVAFGGVSHAVAAAQIIDSAPTIDPVRHAKWVFDRKSRYWVCSLCGGRALERPDTGGWCEIALTDYCPSCGALMEKKVRK